MIQGRLLGANAMVEMKSLELPGIDLEEAGRIARAAITAVQDGTLGYFLLTAKRR